MLSNLQKSVRNAMFVRAEHKTIPADVDSLAWIRTSTEYFRLMSSYLLEEVKSIVERPPSLLPLINPTDKLSNYIDFADDDSESTVKDFLMNAAMAYEQAAIDLDLVRTNINAKGQFTQMATQLQQYVDTSNVILNYCNARDKTWFKISYEERVIETLRRSMHSAESMRSSIEHPEDSPSIIMSGSEETSSPKPIQKKKSLTTKSFMNLFSFTPKHEGEKSANLEQLAAAAGMESELDITGDKENQLNKSENTKPVSNWSIKIPKVKAKRGKNQEKLANKQAQEIAARLRRHEEKLTGLQFMLKEQGTELSLEFDRMLGNRLSLMEEVMAELFHHISHYSLQASKCVRELDTHIPILLDSAKEQRSKKGLPKRRFSWEDAPDSPRHRRISVQGNAASTPSVAARGPEVFSLNTIREINHRPDKRVLKAGTTVEVSAGTIDQFFDSDSHSSSDIPPPTARTRLNSIHPKNIVSIPKIHNKPHTASISQFKAEAQPASNTSTDYDERSDSARSK